MVLLAPLSIGLLGTASSVRADSVMGMNTEGLHAPFGVNLGYTTDRQRGSFLLGGEASLVRSWETRRLLVWCGGYVDARWAPGLERARIGIGPEVGLLVFTLDLGYVLELGRNRPAHGFEVRGLVSLGVLHPYFRSGYVGGSGTFLEGGLLLKYPVPIEPSHRIRRRTHEAVSEAPPSEP